MRPWLLVLLLTFFPRVLHADLIVSATGKSRLDAAGTASAAVDVALRKAVEQAALQIVGEATYRGKTEIIQKRILRAAKSYVRSYRIISQEQGEGEVTCTVEATLDESRLGDDLRAIGVGAKPVATPPAVIPLSTKPARPKAILRVTAGAEEGLPPLPESFNLGLAQALEGLGFELMAEQGPRNQEDSHLVREARARGATAVLATMQVRDGGPVRGTNLHGAEVEISVRWIPPRDEDSPSDHSLSSAGYGKDFPTAVAHAVRVGIPRILSELPASRGQVEFKDERLVVQLDRVSRWQEVADLMRALSQVPGVADVTVARLAPRKVFLAIKGQVSSDGLVRALASAPSVSPTPPVIRRDGPSRVVVELPEIPTMPSIQDPVP
ncbi:MAG: hypothetical protein HY698_13740 [Deltaproteobacteria bacterium]|nr:hypothetical protein [Deltaproteobacteria bacterium]